MSMEGDVFTDDVLAAEASWEDFHRGGPGVWYNARPKRVPYNPPDENEQDAQAREDAKRDMEGDRGR